MAVLFNLRCARAVVLVGLLVGCKKAPPIPVAPPRLVVMLVVDQLRGDEIEAYSGLWRYGFRRLRDEGRWYTHAHHTHGRTETAAGHATVATGVLPRVHGVVDKNIYLRERRHVVNICDFGRDPCTPDALMVPAVGDRLRARIPGAQVVALAEKARSASLLGGKLADLVAWHDERQIGLVGRTAGKPGLPPWLELFFARVAAPDRIAHMWELPRLPKPLASRPDRPEGKETCGLGPSFPHQLSAREGAELVAQWHCTPDSDRVVAETALEVAKHMNLGKDDIPDLLLVSFSAVDVVGHAFGYESRERLAVLTELDRQLGDLLQGLHTWVGPRLLVALTSDHGVAPRVFTARGTGQPSGRVPPAELVACAEAALQDMGPGPHVAALAFPFLHLADELALADRLAAALKVSAALRAHPYVYKAWSLSELADDEDPVAKLMQANTYPERSGDVVMVLKPYFTVGTRDTGADHGTPWEYDRQVPVLLWGESVMAGRVDQSVAVVDLLRTISDRLGLPVDPNGGKPLP